MKLLKERPGEIFLALFITAGITFTILATVAETNSGLAGRGFDDGLINGSSFQGEENR